LWKWTAKGAIEAIVGDCQAIVVVAKKRTRSFVDNKLLINYYSSISTSNLDGGGEEGVATTAASSHACQLWK